MPRRDGTGPMGAGSMTGRGLGACESTVGAHLTPATGLGCQRRAGSKGAQGHGFGRGLGRGVVRASTPKEMLEQQRDTLQKRLDNVNSQLKNI